MQGEEGKRDRLYLAGGKGNKMILTGTICSLGIRGKRNTKVVVDGCC